MEQDQTMTEEIFTPLSLISDPVKIEKELPVPELANNYWESEHVFIFLDTVILVVKRKYEDEIAVFIRDIPPQVYPLIKGEEDVGSFLEKLREYRGKDND